jgi:PDZ domain
MLTKTICVLWLCLLGMTPAEGQSGFFMSPGQKQIDIPFEFSNNFIILTVTMNGTFPLRFIFDTGAEHTILSKREISDMLQVQYEREFKVKGSDLKTDLIAYLARRIRFDIPNKVVAPREDILVLEEDYFRFEEYAGVNVHGIMSANVFSKYITRINYERRIITLFDRSVFKQRVDGFTAIPVEVFRNKMYLSTQIQPMRDSSAMVKLLIDTGAGLPLLLFSNTHPLVVPPPNAITANIGMGLGGYLEGFTGRVSHLQIGEFSQSNIVTYFQTLDTAGINLDYLNGRNGLIGNALLSRFIVVLDFYGSKIWLKPGKTYKSEFGYDRSGLNIITSGSSLNSFIVQTVLPNSPASDVGIQNGDQIMRIGAMPASVLTLSDLQRILQKKAGKKVRLVIRREGKRYKKTLKLRDLI